MSHDHYKKDVSGLTMIDVYRVLSLFGVTDPCIQHACKKLLATGVRGHKDAERDIQDAIDSLTRWQDMRREDAERLSNRHPATPNVLEFDEARMDVIGTNGNDGLHYDELDPILPCGKRWSEAPEWASKLAKLKSHDDFYWIQEFKVKSRCKCVDADLTYVLDQADIDALFVVSERPSAKG